MRSFIISTSIIFILFVRWRDSNASTNITQSINAAKDALDIVEQVNNLTNNSITKKLNKFPRKPRSTSISDSIQSGINTVDKAFHASKHFLVSKVFGLVNKAVASVSGNSIPANYTDQFFPAVRNKDLSTEVFLFTLTHQLNKRFEDLIRDKAPETGDIISCRIPDSSFAEHYMMIYDDTHLIEIGTPDGTKVKNEGKILMTLFNNSNYFKSEECLFHKNLILAQAADYDVWKDNGGLDEYSTKINEVAKRIKSTLSKKGALDYKTLTCNCQDLVLYWAYGLVFDEPCVKQFFGNNESIVHRHSLEELRLYYFKLRKEMGLVEIDPKLLNAE